MPISTASALDVSAYTLDGTLLADFIKDSVQDAKKIVSQNAVVQNLHTMGRPNNSPSSDLAKTLRSAALWTGMVNSSSRPQEDSFPFFGERIHELISAFKKSC